MCEDFLYRGERDIGSGLESNAYVRSAMPPRKPKWKMLTLRLDNGVLLRDAILQILHISWHANFDLVPAGSLVAMEGEDLDTVLLETHACLCRQDVVRAGDEEQRECDEPRPGEGVET